MSTLIPHQQRPDQVPAVPHLPGARTGRDPARAIKRGPSRVPPEVVAATQRDRLFDAVVHTVAEKGYRSARVADICLAAGVTRPAFYALFAGKEDAFVATYRHGTEVLWRMIEEAHNSMPEWRSAVRSGIHVLLSVLASVPTFATMAIVEIEAVGPAARAERDRLLRRFTGFFVDAPQPLAGMPDGEPLDREELVSSVVGGMYTTIHRHVASGATDRLPDLLPVLTYFALVPFLGPEDAARGLNDDNAAPVVASCAPAIERSTRGHAGGAPRSPVATPTT